MKSVLIKRLTAGVLSTLLPIISLDVGVMKMSVSAIDDGSDYLHEDVLGVPAFDDISFNDYITHYDDGNLATDDVNAPMDTNYNYGTSCDLSESEFFPAIGSQIGGSCTSWATTYYQFTYEANKLNNINTRENNELAYSPVWTFNFLNGGEDRGAFIYEAYDWLREHGALKLSDCPLSAPLYTWSNNTAKMIEALNTRVVNDGAIWINSDNASQNLDEIKQMLYGTDGTDGKVLTFSTTNRWNTGTGEDLNSGQTVEVAYRCYTGGAHSMTVVGYNDNIWVDINGNGQIDIQEKGAFKVANSWGTGGINQGFLWVSYDALNSTSLVSGDWENNLPATRNPAFQFSNPNLSDTIIHYLEENYPDYDEAMYHEYYNRYVNSNAVYWIEVENKTPMYVGQLYIDSDLRNSLEYYAGRSASNEMTSTVDVQKFWVQGNNELSYTGTLVFDYADLCDPIGDYISGYNWYIDLNGTHNTTSFKITDNLSNTIVDFGSISTGASYMPISLSMGDLNYDGVVDADDTTILNNARHGNGVLSNLQEYLATNMNEQDDDYTISYNAGATWGDGETGDTYQSIEITITNNGDTPIRNWAIRCNDFCGTPTGNIWNGIFFGDNIIKNADYNSDIASGQSVTVGYIIKNPTGETPVFSLCTFRAARTDGYEVEITENNSWGSEFVGTITITNTTNEPIMAWELTFDAENFEIDSTGQFEILAHSGNTYTITGTYNGNIPIPANTSISMQFNGTKTGTPSLSNISMTEMRF